MRVNGFKKALILAAAAFVTAVIGVGGAKLKVQAAIYDSGSKLDISASDVDSFIKEGVTIGRSSHDGNSWNYYFYSYTGLSPDLGISCDGSNPDTAVIPSTTPGDDWWVIESVDAGTRTVNLRRACVITYKNDDDTVLQVTPVKYNTATVPAYDDATNGTPTKAATIYYTYSHSGWTPAYVTPVVADAEYTATYTETPRTYTITWINYDGTVLETDIGVAPNTLPTFDAGTPSRPEDENYTYTFSRWDPDVQLVTADATYTAVYLQDPKPAPVTGGGEDDSSSSSGDGSNSGDGTNGGANGGANGNRAPKTADTMPGIIVIALAGLLGGALLITGGRKFSK